VWIRTWFNYIEQLLEVWLLSGVKIASTLSAATGKFASLVAARWSNGEALDYFKAIQEARELKSPTTKSPTTNETRAGGKVFFPSRR
jgi:hypothetical protein